MRSLFKKDSRKSKRAYALRINLKKRKKLKEKIKKINNDSTF